MAKKQQPPSNKLSALSDIQPVTINTGAGTSTVENTLRSNKNGFDYDANPQMKQFFEHYVSTHDRVG